MIFSLEEQQTNDSSDNLSVSQQGKKVVVHLANKSFVEYMGAENLVG